MAQTVNVTLESSIEIDETPVVGGTDGKILGIEGGKVVEKDLPTVPTQQIDGNTTKSNQNEDDIGNNTASIGENSDNINDLENKQNPTPKTASAWASDTTVYASGLTLSVTDELYRATNQMKFKRADGSKTFADLDFMPIGSGTVSVDSSDITFKSAMIFGTFSTPITTPITSSNLGAIVGIQQKIYHQAASFTPPAGWVLLGSGIYMPDEVNIIYAEWSAAGRIEYWITQEA